MSNNTCSTNSIPVPTELIQYQDWAYVEVIRDYHKHLGNESSKSKLALLNEVIKPFRKQKGDDLAALRFMTLALYMGDIMTDGCMRALALVRDHKLNAQVVKRNPVEAFKSEEDAKPKPCKKATQTNVPSRAEAKSGVDAFVEAIYGGRKKFDELLNDFFGFDINEARGMSAAEFGEYYTRCKKIGWKKASKKA